MRTIIALFLCAFLLASCASSRVAFKKDYNFAKINSIKIGQFSPASGYPNSSSVVANEFIRQLLAMGYTVKTDPSDKADVELFGSVTQFNPNRKYLMQASNTTDTTGQNIIINNTQPMEINGSQVYTLGSSLGPDANLSIIATNANCGIAAYLKDSITGDVVWSTTYSYESLDLAAAAENTVRYILSDLPPEKKN